MSLSCSGEDAAPGLRDTLGELRHVAGVVRDRLSGDTWRILNQLHQDLRGRGSGRASSTTCSCS